MKSESADLQTLARGLDVLGGFFEKDELGISELARLLALPKSATHRVVRTLANRGFIEQTPTRRYRLGIHILELGMLCRLRLDLTALAQPILQKLSQCAGNNAHLAKLDGSEVFDLIRVEYPAPLRIAKNPMLRRPVHCTALGKALLAFGDPARVEEVVNQGLTRLTRKSITQPERFFNEMARVRKFGYAVDNEEFYLGIRCIAAPVFDERAKAIAAISVSCLITQLTEDRVPQFAVWVKEAAAELSKRLGCADPGTSTR